MIGIRSFLSSVIVAIGLILPTEVLANGSSQQCNIMPAHDNKKINILYFYVNNHDESFWHLHQQVTEAAAKSLGINLISVAIEEEYRHRIAYLDLVKRHLDSDNKPDAAIGIFYAKGEANLLTLFEQYQVPFFSVNTSLDEPTWAALQLPRQRYAQWLGHMAPDDYQGGYDLAVQLNRQPGERAALVAIAGALQSAVSNNRKAGYLAAADAVGFTIMPSFSTDWTPENSRMVVDKALERLPDIDTIWTAGPDIAKGAFIALQNISAARRESMRIGTFDWSKDVVDMMQKEQVVLSYGGHFAEGAWALIMLVDYLNGIDFVEDIGVKFNTQLEALTRDNIDRYAAFLTQEKWQHIDFKKYSKCYTPALKQYHFSATQLLHH
ncbi:hypothetical protein DRW07_01050 [Alteromonas sediminis]|uniref:Periplasmic binding protein domain-containing protein n=1 Tax=Alteromonas sediminis TaxID=2259342 RepID=A0A3N5Y2P1_9ALTE|nr:ABC transporter substrate-binding protein [Alteromonas sediminis]RPJ68032.1 hypothetical protein DRW07_01050 [Alteromonas sediminis]